MKIIERKNELLGEKYSVIHHTSGLDIYVFPKKLSKYYALFATKYGAIDNAFKLAGDAEVTRVPDGIAHFLEHKMFENEDGVDTFERYAKYGANANAFTSNKETAYLFSCTEHFADNLEILLDFVTHPYFTPETVEKEQGIIGQEIRMYEDNAQWKLFMGLMNAMYKVNNMRVDVAGTSESISHITDKILYKCYDTFYNLNNMALAVSGDLSVDEVVAVADRVLKKAPELKIERIYPEGETAEVYKKRSEAKLQVARPIFMIGVKSADIPEEPLVRKKKAYVMNILGAALFSRSGEFYNDLYGSGLISPRLGYGFDSDQYYSFYSLSGESDKPEEVYDKFVAYIEKVKAAGVSPDDFERCKRVCYAGCITEYESSEDCASMLISSAFDGCDPFDYPALIASITLDDVNSALRTAFDEKYYCMSVVNPLD